jgi:hypothetical protein
MIFVQSRTGDFGYGVRKRFVFIPSFGETCVANELVRLDADGTVTTYPETGGSGDLIPRAILPDGRVLSQELSIQTNQSRWVCGPAEGPFVVHPVQAFIDQTGLFLTYVSEDGTAFFFADLATEQRSLIRWTEATGPVPIEPNFVRPIPANSSADAASPNGTILVGNYRRGLSTKGFYWSLETGFVDLIDYLTDSGFEVPYTDIFPNSVSNDGRIIHATGVLTGASPVNRSIQITLPASGVDSDGDGLPDDWEREGGGIDVDGDGEIEISLFDLGARPDRKDLFLEIDGTRGFFASDETIAMLVAAFDNAPVSNPNGVNGIALHVDATERGIDAPAIVPFEGQNWPPLFDVL